MHMNKMITAVTAAFFLTACGGTDAPVAETSKSAPPAAKPVVEMTPVQRGAKLYARCRACHTLEQEGRHKVGPNLWGVYGAKSAAKEGYAYSKAIKAANITWDETTMDGYLKKPAEFMPGNKMAFIGLKKQADRDAIQAYLKEKTSP